MDDRELDKRLNFIENKLQEQENYLLLIMDKLEIIDLDKIEEEKENEKEIHNKKENPEQEPIQKKQNQNQDIEIRKTPKKSIQDLEYEEINNISELI